MLEEEFSQGNSYLHRLDPRAKIILAFCFATVTAVSQNPKMVCLAGTISLTLLLISRLNLKAVAARVLLVNTFIAFCWLILPFSMAGEPLFTFGPLIATRQGIDFALLITLKSNAILLAFIALVTTSTIPDLGKAMLALKLPPKLCHLLLFTYRHIHLILEERKRMIVAAKMRGFKPGTNLHTYRTYAFIIGMVLVRSWNRSERVMNAMRLRGFQGRLYSLNHFHLRKRDALFAAAILTASAALALAEHCPV